MGLSIQQREREIALLRAVAATPGQIRRMIAWEATIVALVGSAAGIWPGIILGRALAHALVRHGIAPPTFSVTVDWLPIAAVIGGGVTAALLAVLAAGRRAARVPPTLALAEAAVEPRLLGPGRVDRGTARARRRGAAVRRLGHHQRARDRRGHIGDDRPVPRAGGRLPGTDRGARAPAGSSGRRLRGSRRSAASWRPRTSRTATRRFSSASTPLVLTVAMSCTLLFSTTTQDHAVTQQRHAGLAGELAITSTGPGLPAATLADARATPGVRSAVALTPTDPRPEPGSLR